MMPGRTQIEQMVPHAGAMCLLEAVTHWDGEHIACTAAAPQAAHPLARDGAVPAIAAIEYAAQATAVHGALLDGATGARPGMLAKLTGVKLHAATFPQAGPISVHAQMLSRMDQGGLYSFTVGCGGHDVATGQLLVAFGQPGPS